MMSRSGPKNGLKRTSESGLLAVKNPICVGPVNIGHQLLDSHRVNLAIRSCGFDEPADVNNECEGRDDAKDETDQLRCHTVMVPPYPVKVKLTNPSQHI